MEPSRGDSRYNLNYSMSSIGLTLADQADMYGNPNALSSRSPSAGILQGIGGSSGVGLLPRSAGNLISNAQCQSLGNNNNQQRGLKRAGSDCYDDPHQRVGPGGITTLQSLGNCGSSSNVQHSSQQQPQTSSAEVQDMVDDSYNNLQSKKSPPANGKKTKGRVKIKMEYIDNKLRRYTTFSKRKTGIMKKAYELSTLTGTQVMLLVASETGHVYTFATRKLQPMITSEAGKQLIQTCLNSPDPPSLGSGDQRMSATGFEETELSYNIADEDSKELRSVSSSVNDSEESSDNERIANIETLNAVNFENSPAENPVEMSSRNCQTNFNAEREIHRGIFSESVSENQRHNYENETNLSAENSQYSTDLKTIPQNIMLQLIGDGHLEMHKDEDRSIRQYVAIPQPTSSKTRVGSALLTGISDLKGPSSSQTNFSLQREIPPKLIIKEEN